MIKDIILGLIGCAGLWALILEVYRNKRDDHKKEDEKLGLMCTAMRGLLHDRICYLSMQYIKRGSVTESEYRNLVDDMFEPYEKLGGNGTAKRLVDGVRNLNIMED